MDLERTNERNLIGKAQNYLKSHYGEDIVSITVNGNSVVDEFGTLSVHCTVSVNGHESEWSKKVHFRDGKVVNMDARPR